MQPTPNPPHPRPSASPLVLVVEDDVTTSELVCMVLSAHGIHPITAFTAAEAMHSLKESRELSAILLDLTLPDGDGITVMREARKLHPNLPCIILTASDSVDTAVMAMKAGAENYLIKPFAPGTLIPALRACIENYQIQQGIDPRPATPAHSLESWKSPKMKQAVEVAKQAAKTLSPVLISGPISTGKAAIAQFIHQSGRLKTKPFQVVNSAVLTPAQVENSIFGHPLSDTLPERDLSPTRQRSSRDKIATLYIKDVDKLTLPAQEKLLHRIAADQGKPSGTQSNRIIASSSVDMARAVREGTFLSELWYALAVYHVEVPGLAERAEDHEQLCENIITRICVSRKLRRPNLTRQAREAILDHPWPGNLSELFSVLEHAITRTEDGLIRPEDFPALSRPTLPASEKIPMGSASIEDITRLNLIATLKACDGNRRRAAQRLKVSLRTIYNMIQRYELTGKADSDTGS